MRPTAVSSSQINLSWTDNATNETGFKIERKTGAGGTYAEIATVGAGVAAYSDTGLTAATTYFYRVRATNAIGDSAYSNEASATTLHHSSRGTEWLDGYRDLEQPNRSGLDGQRLERNRIQDRT